MATAPSLFSRWEDIRETVESTYRDLHAHPELSMQETRTSAIIAERLHALGLETTTGVGGTGVVATITHGVGPLILLRADMDGLPVTENTGLEYSSTVTTTADDGSTVGVMHACGHDVHVACLLGAVELLATHRDLWSGTIIAVFQPGEELGVGAQAMIDDNFFARFGTPTITLGQHVAPFPAGMIGTHAGPSFAGADSLRVTLFGKGGHGSRPETTIDPVLMAASTVVRLQSVVSREVAASESVVVTVGSIHSGAKDNVIPDDATLGLSIRTYSPEMKAHTLEVVERIVRAEAEASGAERPPEIVHTMSLPALNNDPEAMARTRSAFEAEFGDSRVMDPGSVTGSEDFGLFGEASGAPSCFWLLGGTDPELYAAAALAGRVDRDVPSNHSPEFAPVMSPTLQTGVFALVVAALEWLD